MNISITKDEYEAIRAAADQIATSIHAGDNNYNSSYETVVNNLYKLCEKYEKASYKKECLRKVKKILMQKKI